MHHIAATSRALVIVTYPVIEWLWLPEGFACELEDFVGFTSSMPFPTLHNSADSVIGQGPEHHVHMIRHHYPGFQFISLPIEEPKCSGNNSGNFGAPQPALPLAPVEVCLQLAKIIAFNFLNGLKFGPLGGASNFRGPLPIKVRQTHRSLCFDLKQYFFGKRIRQAKGHKVSSPFSLYVRQVTASVNTRSKPVGLLVRFNSCSPQLKSDSSDPRILFRREHELILISELVTAQESFATPRQEATLWRSAELDSAVSRICNLRGDGKCRTHDLSERPPITNRRYSRLKICATAERYQPESSLLRYLN